MKTIRSKFFELEYNLPQKNKKETIIDQIKKNQLFKTFIISEILNNDSFPIYNILTKFYFI